MGTPASVRVPGATQVAWWRPRATRAEAGAALLAAADHDAIVQALTARRACPEPAAARVRDPGGSRSPWRGHGLDYAQSRAYQPGDDLRAMHWALLARTGRPYVREFDVEQAAPWHALLDAHGGMLFGTRARTKATQAARAVLLAAADWAARWPQSPLTLSLWSAHGLRARSFGRGGAAVARLAQWLMRQRIAPPDLPASPAATSRPALAAWARRLARHGPAPAQLVLCSDFGWFDEAAAGVLWPLARHGRLRALCVSDPVERALPQLPQAPFVDASSGDAGWLDPGAWPRQAFARAAAQRSAQLSGALRALHADVVQLGTEDAVDLLYAAIAQGASR